MKPAGLEERRQQRIKSREKERMCLAARARLAATRTERAELTAWLRKIPLKKLRAIHKAAQQAFSTKP